MVHVQHAYIDKFLPMLSYKRGSFSTCSLRGLCNCSYSSSPFRGSSAKDRGMVSDRRNLRQPKHRTSISHHQRHSRHGGHDACLEPLYFEGTLIMSLMWCPRPCMFPCSYEGPEATFMPGHRDASADSSASFRSRALCLSNQLGILYDFTDFAANSRSTAGTQKTEADGIARIAGQVLRIQLNPEAQPQS